MVVGGVRLLLPPHDVMMLQIAWLPTMACGGGGLGTGGGGFGFGGGGLGVGGGGKGVGKGAGGVGDGGDGEGLGGIGLGGVGLHDPGRMSTECWASYIYLLEMEYQCHSRQHRANYSISSICPFAGT